MRSVVDKGMVALDTWDRQVRLLMRRVGVPALRISVGVVFIWFGGLKVLDVSPVSDLVANTVYWLDASWVVPALGVMEVLVGLCLVTRRFLRLALLWFALQLLGTFMVFLVVPHVAFSEGNPLLLTVEGEFVAKNLVLLAAGLVVGSSVPPLPRSRT